MYITRHKYVNYEITIEFYEKSFATHKLKCRQNH